MEILFLVLVSREEVILEGLGVYKLLREELRVIRIWYKVEIIIWEEN